MYKSFIKPILDILIALTVLLITIPIFILICVTLKISQNKVFFVQKRPGKEGKIFSLYKFSTMTDDLDENGYLLSDASRITKFGKVMRKLSLDELPQLYNVIKGNMSLIGPRPLLIEYLPLYNDEQRRRHSVKPGITGWAQVNGRNEISWKQKFEYDVWYVDNISFFLDFKIFLFTLSKIVKRDGINSGTSATMEKFLGTKGD